MGLPLPYIVYITHYVRQGRAGLLLCVIKNALNMRWQERETKRKREREAVKKQNKKTLKLINARGQLDCLPRFVWSLGCGTCECIVNAPFVK